MKCILNVTDYEFAKILQYNHDGMTWKNDDQVLLDKLTTLLGEDVVAQIRGYEECRMEKRFDMEGVPRIELDTRVDEHMHVSLT